jgi:hypothetical protein
MYRSLQSPSRCCRLTLSLCLALIATSLVGCGVPDFSNIYAPTPNDWSGGFSFCSAVEKEQSLYTYTDAGALQSIERHRMNGILDRITYTDGRVSSRSVGFDGEGVRATWLYEGDLLSRVEVFAYSDTPSWTLALTHDDQGRVVEAQALGFVSSDLIHDLSGQLTRLERFDTPLEVVDGVNLHWPPDAAFASTILEGSGQGFIVRYAYDGEGRLTEALWDTNGDGRPNFVRADSYDDVARTHTTTAAAAARPQQPFMTVTRAYTEEGLLLRRDLWRGPDLASSQWWTRDDLPAAHPCGASSEVNHMRDWDGDGVADEVLVKQYDADERLVFDAILTGDGLITDRTYTVYLPNARLEVRDRDANGEIDQTTRYVYGEDGGLRAVEILENKVGGWTLCQSLGNWPQASACVSAPDLPQPSP